MTNSLSMKLNVGVCLIGWWKVSLHEMWLEEKGWTMTF